MYQAYWGLADSPFRGHLDVKTFYQAPTQDEALARLHFLVEEQRTLGLLLGNSGSGKSLVLEVFAGELRRAGQDVALVNIGLVGIEEFLWRLAGQLGVEVLGDATQFKLVRAIDDLLTARTYQQLATVILLDDADEAREEVIEHVVRFSQLAAIRDPRLTTVASAQSRRVDHLGARLLELSELRIDLEGWELDDTIAYIRAALARAGRSTPLFTPDGLRRLHELSGGIPRRVKQMADLALIAGAGQNLTQIESETIEAVFHELAVTAAPSLSLVTTL
jgi:general secretion pathway protein A